MSSAAKAQEIDKRWPLRLNSAIASRIVALMSSRWQEKVVFVRGVAKNLGLRMILEGELGTIYMYSMNHKLLAR